MNAQKALKTPVFQGFCRKIHSTFGKLQTFQKFTHLPLFRKRCRLFSPETPTFVLVLTILLQRLNVGIGVVLSVSDLQTHVFLSLTTRFVFL
jgi:hypothetical protein